MTVELIIYSKNRAVNNPKRQIAHFKKILTNAGLRCPHSFYLKEKVTYGVGLKVVPGDRTYIPDQDLCNLISHVLEGSKKNYEFQYHGIKILHPEEG